VPAVPPESHTVVPVVVALVVPFVNPASTIQIDVEIVSVPVDLEVENGVGVLLEGGGHGGAFRLDDGGASVGRDDRDPG
jgi:hypothetical protein